MQSAARTRRMSGYPKRSPPSLPTGWTNVSSFAPKWRSRAEKIKGTDLNPRQVCQFSGMFSFRAIGRLREIELRREILTTPAPETVERETDQLWVSDASVPITS